MMKINPADWDHVFDELAREGGGLAGRSREAVLRESRRRLSRDSRDTAALHLLAAANLQAGRSERTLALLEQNSHLLREDATSNRLAGYAHLAQSRPTVAKIFFDRAVKLSPHQPDVWSWLGKIHEHLGRTDQAIVYYRRGSFFDGHSYESTVALVRLLSRRRRRSEAVSLLRQALKRDRRSPVLNSQLARQLRRQATVVRRQGNARQHHALLQEAMCCLKVAVAANPSVANWMALGTTAEQLEDYDAAKQAFQRVVDLAPDHAAASTKLATLQIDDGEIDSAANQLRRVLKNKPGHAEAHFRFSRIQKCRPGEDADKLVDELRELIGKAKRRQDQVQLRFALAKTLDDIGQYEEAWNQYDTANSSKPRHSNATDPQQQIDEFAAQIDQRVQITSPEFFQQRRGWGLAEARPIFIVGMPRSGTTLTEQILSSHQEIEGAGELKYIEQLRKQVCFDFAVANGIEAGPQRTDLLRKIPEARLKEAGDAYMRWSTGNRMEAARVVDKMPTNFLNLDLIAVLFPQATVIHCRRDPMDVLVSSYCQNLNAPFCDLPVLVEYYRQYRRLMRHWEQVLPMTIYHVDYEKLVSQPEPNVRYLLNACDVAWDESCLRFHQNERAVRTPSKWQVRQPMYRSSVGKWRRFEKFLTGIERQVRAIEAEFDPPA